MKKLQKIMSLFLTVLLAVSVMSIPALAANDTTAYIWIGGEMRSVGTFKEGKTTADDVYVANNTEIIRLFPTETRDISFTQEVALEQLKPWADRFGYTMSIDGVNVFLFKVGSNNPARKSASVFKDNVLVNDVTVYYSEGSSTVYADKTALAKVFPELANSITFESMEAYTLNYWANRYGYEMTLGNGRVDLNMKNSNVNVVVYVNGQFVSNTNVYYQNGNTSVLYADVATLIRIFPNQASQIDNSNNTLGYWASRFGYTLAFNNNRVDLNNNGNSNNQNRTSVSVFVNNVQINYVDVYYVNGNTNTLYTDVASLNRIFPENYNKFDGNDLTLNYWANRLGYTLTVNGTRVDLTLGNGNGNNGNNANVPVVVYVNGTQITNTNAYYNSANTAQPNSTIIYADRVTLERIFSGYTSQLTFNDGNDYTVNAQASKLGFTFSFNLDTKRVDLIKQTTPNDPNNPGTTSNQYTLVVDGVTSSVHPTLTYVGNTAQLQVTAQEANHILNMCGVSMTYNQPTDVVSLAVRCGYSVTSYQNRVYFHSAGEKPIEVRINGTPVDFSDQGPVVKEGRTMIPVRKVTELLGADVQWNGNDQSVTITKGSTTLLLYIGRSDFYVGGVQMWFDVAPQVMNGRTLLPIRFVAEALGYAVGWDGTQPVSLVTITN